MSSARFDDFARFYEENPAVSQLGGFAVISGDGHIHIENVGILSTVVEGLKDKYQFNYEEGTFELSGDKGQGDLTVTRYCESQRRFVKFNVPIDWSVPIILLPGQNFVGWVEECLDKEYQLMIGEISVENVMPKSEPATVVDEIEIRIKFISL